MLLLSLIIRHLSMFIDAEMIYYSMAEIIEGWENVEVMHASIFVPSSVPC